MLTISLVLSQLPECVQPVTRSLHLGQERTRTSDGERLALRQQSLHFLKLRILEIRKIFHM